MFHVEGKWENENQDEANGATRENGVKNVMRTLDAEKWKHLVPEAKTVHGF
jgi:hypothetical protein